ncbi:MAG: hypothetical protein EOO29_37540, partial [Comamonadaceae bacterium]
MSPLHDPDDLRPDPHLRRMLDQAPDADPRPAEATRATILATAHRAVTAPMAAHGASAQVAGVSGALLRWLDRLLPRFSAPWTVALATVVLASFITLMWHGEPVPQAQPDGGMAPALRRAPAD